MSTYQKSNSSVDVGGSPRFTYQTNQFYGECLPCTAAVFNRLIDSRLVKYNIDTRQAVEKAISEGTPLVVLKGWGSFSVISKIYKMKLNYGKRIKQEY